MIFYVVNINFMHMHVQEKKQIPQKNQHNLNVMQVTTPNIAFVERRLKDTKVSSCIHVSESNG